MRAVLDTNVLVSGISVSHPTLDYQAVLATLVGHGTLIPDPDGSEPITADPDDDKFMLCAERAGAKVISGDKHLLEATGWSGVEVHKPRDFLSLLRSSSSTQPVRVLAEIRLLIPRRRSLRHAT